MRRLAFLIALAISLIGLSISAAVGWGVTNEDCTSCHRAGSAGNLVDFHVAPVDKSKCASCHWLQKHYFDDLHAGSIYSDYMLKQCNSCHHSSDTWPDRPAPFVGNPQTSTSYGWFQSSSSIEATAGELHRIHANGSWLKDNSACTGCHGAASCEACHGAPSALHTDHTKLEPGTETAYYSVGKKFGDTVPDTYIYAYVPTGNYNSASILAVGKTTRGEERALIGFPLEKLGNNITKVTVSLTRANTTVTPLRAYRLRRPDWSETQASWNNYKAGSAWTSPGASDAANDYFSDTYSEAATGTNFDVTALVAAARAAGSPSLDLVIVDPAPVAGRHTTFYSNNAAFADWLPRLSVEGTVVVDRYANPPVRYAVALGSPIGQEDLARSAVVDSTCINDSCHSLSKTSGDDFVPMCVACHPFDSLGDSHEAAHTPAGLDDACQSCHKDSLTQEHLKNTATQTSALDCSSCHDSPQLAYRWSIFAGDKRCSACHLTAHTLGLTPTPQGIPQYPGFAWSPVVDATLFGGESWLPTAFATEGNLLISNRRADVTAEQAWAFYRDEMAANGWTLTSPPPPAGAARFAVTFTKSDHTTTVLFYDGETFSAGSPSATGSRVEVLYK